MYESQVRPNLYGRKLVPPQSNRHHKNSSSSFEPTASINRDHPSAHFQFWRVASLSLLAISLLIITGCGSLNYNSVATSNSQALSDLSCGTQSLTGAQSKSCSISLKAPALTLTTVMLSSDNSALQVPAQVKIPVGQSSATFNAVTAGVKKTATATITATSRGVRKTSALTLYPASTASLTSISCTAQALTGPASDTCTLHLGSAASSALPITLKSSSSAIQVPQVVTISAGSDSAQFLATASAVSSAQNVILTAAAGGATQTIAISLQPSGSQASGPHKVQLNWAAPSGSGQTIVGYNIYRTVTDVSSYALLTSLDPQTTYSDTGVLSGLTYGYVVTSVDSNGAESAPSNSTRVTIP
jgi:hypothetical protein